MSRYYDDEGRERERDEEPREVPTMTVEPGQCCICGRPGREYGCFSCGHPVCYNEQDYFGDSSCGGWTLDSWHPDHPEENTFYCTLCMCAVLVPPDGVTTEDLNIQYTDH